MRIRPTTAIPTASIRTSVVLPGGGGGMDSSGEPRT